MIQQVSLLSNWKATVYLCVLLAQQALRPKPVTAGDSGECFVERVHGQTLADFNYIAFSNCYMNGNGIGNWPHNYYVMVNSSGQEMAGPGPITNNGLNYNVNWYLSH